MLSHQKKAAAAKYLQDGEDIYCAGVHTHVSMVLQLLHKRNGLVEQGKTTFTLLSLILL